MKYESSTSNGSRDLKIYIPGAVDTTRTVEITYTVRNGTRFFKDYDEFYWNVTGNDWPVPIDHASAPVHFPLPQPGRCGRRRSPESMDRPEHDATAEVAGRRRQLRNEQSPAHARRADHRYLHSQGYSQRARAR